MYPQAQPAARNTSLPLGGAIVAAIIGLSTLALGLYFLDEALDNPAPRIVDCKEDALQSVGPDVWTELKGCKFDVEGASELTINGRLAGFYIPLREPKTGALVGLYATDDQELLIALSDPSPRGDAAVNARIAELIEPPLQGFSSHARRHEEGLLRHMEEFGPADMLLVHGREPRKALSILLLGLASVSLLAATILGFRVKRARSADAADLAAWRAQQVPQPEPHNPYG